jgi:Protein of unknown function (DUF3106)
MALAFLLKIHELLPMISVAVRSARFSRSPTNLKANRLWGALALAVSIAFSSNVTSAQAQQPVADDSQARNLAALTQPLWVDLSPAQQQALEPFAQKWNTFPTTEKKAWMKVVERIGAMTADQRQKLNTRMRQWAELTPEQRVRARANFNLASKAPAEQRNAEFAQYRSMTPEQRKILRAAGSTSNTAALYAGARTGLAPQAAQPIASDGVAAVKPAPTTKKTVTK